MFSCNVNSTEHEWRAYLKSRLLRLKRKSYFIHSKDLRTVCFYFLEILKFRTTIMLLNELYDRLLWLAKYWVLPAPKKGPNDRVFLLPSLAPSNAASKISCMFWHNHRLYNGLNISLLSWYIFKKLRHLAIRTISA